MEEKAINHLIAECLGWKFVPDFCADLNACHEMEKTLSEDDIGSYLVFLARLTANPAPRPTFATARQRCEAFLKVKGLWKP